MMPDVTTMYVGFALGLIVGVSWRDSYDIIHVALNRSTHRRGRGSMSRYKFKSERINVAAVVMIFALVQIMTGIFMIVQYSRLTGFIDCQAAYNQTTSDVRQERLPASNRENEKLFDAVEITQETGLGSPEAKDAFAKALRAHERYLKVQQENPYESPSDTCGKVRAP